MESRELSVRCCIAGGGPAGMILGLLLARAGISVVVLEKHSDFLRDFRGDTIHPSTLEIMYELGLLSEFLSRPHSNHPFVFDDQVIDLCRHFKLESGIMPCVLNDKIQKIPLWHEGNETAVRRQMGKIRDLQKIVADLPAEGSRLLVRAA